MSWEHTQMDQQIPCWRWDFSPFLDLTIILNICIPVLTAEYFIGHVALFFANNYLTEYRITIEFLTQFSLDPDVIFSSHTMFINASTKEFTLVNNAISSYDIAFEHLLYYSIAPPSYIMKLAYR